MRSEKLEDIIDDAVYKVIWEGYKPKYEFLAAYVPGTMMSEEWDPSQMLSFELMALNARKQNGFDIK
mgnify:CR=1 FL=1